MTAIDDLWKWIATCENMGLMAIPTDMLRDRLDEFGTCDPDCIYYHPNEVHLYPDACQYGRLGDSYPPDYFCRMLTKQPRCPFCGSHRTGRDMNDTEPCEFFCHECGEAFDQEDA
jgi:hypothetical protein